VLLEVVDLATQACLDRHAWQLTWTMTTFLQRQWHLKDQIAMQTAAMHAAKRMADPALEALAHRDLARAHTRSGDDNLARYHFEQALTLHTELDDHAGLGHTHQNIALINEKNGQYAKALHHARKALSRFRSANHQPGQARTLNSVGYYHALCGDFERALVFCRQALAMHQQQGDHYGQSGPYGSLAFAYLNLDRFEEAIACAHDALEIYQQAGDRYNYARMLIILGDAYQAAADVTAARESWRRALEILCTLDHPDADKVGRRLGV
jgi:tetratricopeptide (TPR) repeat protein